MGFTAPQKKTAARPGSARRPSTTTVSLRAVTRVENLHLIYFVRLTAAAQSPRRNVNCEGGDRENVHNGTAVVTYSEAGGRRDLRHHRRRRRHDFGGRMYPRAAG